MGNKLLLKVRALNHNKNLLIYGTRITLHYAHMHIHYRKINIEFKNIKTVAYLTIIILGK